MEISQFNPRKVADENVIKVKLRHPGKKVVEYLKDEDGNFLIVEVYGKDSEIWRNAALNVQRRNGELAQQGQIRTVEDTDGDLIEIMAAATRSIPELTSEGVPIKSASELYEKEHWIAEQVLQAATDREQAFLAVEPD